MCGFLTVSAYSVYNDYYQGLSESLGEWMYTKMQSDLNALEDDVSATATA